MENGIGIWHLLIILITLAPAIFVLFSKKIIGRKKVVWLVVAFSFFLALNLPF